jgi:hypothetical protein
MFSYCDNLFFDYDERYCSFIGSIFAFQCNGWYILVNDKETIWDTYLGIIEYRRELERNTNLKGNQVYAWNTAHLFIKQNNEDISYIIDEFYNNDKLELKNKINLFNFLFLINKLNRYIDKFELFNCGQYNKSCGTILIDIEYVNTAYKLYKQLYSDMGSDFRYADFDKIFGSKRNMLYKAIEIGSIHKGFFNPLTYVSDIKKNKYKQKYVELIMSDEEKDLAIKFVKSLKELIKKSRNNINVEEIFNERKKYKLVDKLLNLDKCNEFQEVIDYVYSNKKYNDNENLLNFLTFCKYKFIY